MTVTVVLPTRSAVWALGSVIRSAVARGHEVRLEVGPSTTKDPWYPGDLAAWATLARGSRGCRIGLATQAGVDVGVAHWWDNCWAPPPEGQRVTGYLSAWHRDLHARLWPTHAAAIRRQPIIGWTLADQRAALPAAPRTLLVAFTQKRGLPGRRWGRAAGGARPPRLR